MSWLSGLNLTSLRAPWSPHLARLGPHLQQLTVTRGQPPSLDPLTPLRSLTSLSLEGRVDLNNMLCRSLSEALPQLRHLEVIRSTATDLSPLTSLTNLVF